MKGTTVAKGRSSGLKSRISASSCLFFETAHLPVSLGLSFFTCEMRGEKCSFCLCWAVITQKAVPAQPLPPRRASLPRQSRRHLGEHLTERPSLPWGEWSQSKSSLACEGLEGMPVSTGGQRHSRSSVLPSTAYWPQS